MTTLREPTVKSDTKPSSRNQLRIIGGKWRGRKLDFPSIDGLRPTGDRIRETLFNWLAPYVVEARCLDLFSGSGALGFEAVSRGAASAHLIDANEQAVNQLKENCAKIDADNIDITCDDAIIWLQNRNGHGPFDIIFLDPPFEKRLFDDVIAQLSLSSALSSEALIYVETPREYEFSTPSHWHQLKQKHAGQVSFYLYECRQLAQTN
ncbi:MAG: 16S rRNA (guanine(966)-N(2))-methyltransferase RsmD [Cellvibrionaceae bacterium]